MAQKISLTAQSRTDKPKAVRRAGNIPVVLYGDGIASQSATVNYQEFQKVYEQAGETSLVELTIGDANGHTVLIREVQYHPVNGDIVHADLYQVKLDETITAEVPLKFVGESPAVKNLGGVLVRSLDHIELEALPQDLPHDIEVDISVLDDFEKVLHVSDLKLSDKIKAFHEPEEVVALVQAPRSEEELEQLSEEVSEDVEKVEGVKEEEATDEESAEGEEKKAE